MTILSDIQALTGRGFLAIAEGEGGGSSIVVQYLYAGGWMMYVILAISVIGLVIFFERSFDLFLLKRLNARYYMARLVEHLEHRRFRQALDACQVKTRHPLVAVTKAGILRANRREKEVERAMENEMLAALPSLQKRVAIMGLLANISTLLGLLGTIFGLISAFTAVSTASAAEKQTALAAGISQAMYTTAFGISVAIPLLFFHHILSKRSEKILVEVEGGATSVIVALTGRVTDSGAADKAAA